MPTDLSIFNVGAELSQEDQLGNDARTARSVKEIDRILKDPCCPLTTQQMLIAKTHLINEDELQKTLANPTEWHPEIIRVAKEKQGDPG